MVPVVAVSFEVHSALVTPSTTTTREAQCRRSWCGFPFAAGAGALTGSGQAETLLRIQADRSIVRSLRSAPALSARSTGSAVRVQVRQLNGARDCQIRVVPSNGHDKPAGRHLSTSVHAPAAEQTK